MTPAIINKLLHGPTMSFKGRPYPDNLSVAKELFRLSRKEITGAYNS